MHIVYYCHKLLLRKADKCYRTIYIETKEKNMKKPQKIIAMALSAVMVTSLLCVQAFGADTKTVQINGYDASELPSAKPQLEINNVLSTIALDKSMKVTATTYEGETLWATADDFDGAYNAAAPVTIKTVDDGGYFAVYKLQQSGSIFHFDDASWVPYTSCKVQVEDDDGATRTIDYNDITEDDYLSTFLSGSTVTLTEPGSYFVEFQYDILFGSTQVFVNIGGSSNPTTPTKTTATPNASTIMVNGVKTAFDAYLINGNNYIKLRDFAKAVNGTEKQFQVSYDAAKDAIALTSRTAYTVVGGELAAGDGKVKDAIPSSSKIIQDGTEIGLAVYKIGDYNYFKLRDLAKTFNIGVTYDGTVGIDTSIGYSE